MDIKNVRSDFVVGLWIALLVYLAGMTYIMVDIQMRLGRIEHYMAHQIRGDDFGSFHGIIGEK